MCFGDKKPRNISSKTRRQLEEAYIKLRDSPQCKSLLKKYLTEKTFDKLKKRTTDYGSNLLDVIQSGVENLDSGIGVYAPDPDAYETFAELFNPIIQEYHGGFSPTDRQPQIDFGDVDSIRNLDPEGNYIISTRVRCGRSIQGYPFNPCMTEPQYLGVEAEAVGVLKKLRGEYNGTYYSLSNLDASTKQKLTQDHFLFKEGDRFLQAASACRFWPTGRGIFHNEDKTFLVWINEEDHLRIISMQRGGDLGTVYRRLVQGVNALGSRITFSRSPRLGFLTFCPTNLGTTIRASVHIKLPKLSADMENMLEVANYYNLQIRGTSGEHTSTFGNTFDISNRRRLGLTEYEAVKEMQDGISQIIELERSM